MTSEIRHNQAKQRFEAGEGTSLAHLDYRLHDGTVNMFHTEVPPAFQGQGIAGKLATAALTWTRESGHKVLPGCSYVKTFIARHPEFSDLVCSKT